MKLVAPPFVNHDGKPIFSCDIHPDGLRFATGGQGSASGRIAIWNLKPVLDEAVDSDENVPKCLCLLDNHAHCVNSVRWSHCGKNLASGGDDKLIMIWVRMGEARLNAMGVPAGLEQWRCVHTLSSHESDVLDVSWGPDDTRLASCSVDNTVIVWNMDGRPSVLKKLFGHSGLVKGVAWDPVGEYLASQSDDRSLRIWRTSDWKQQIAITEPFKECGDITHVLRLDWSPDGLYIVSAHASNSGGPTAQIIERAVDVEKKCWLSEMDFVGHRKAVTCVKFNRSLMTTAQSESKFCLVATGSRDCSIAIWSTQNRRPIVALKNCFTRSVVDMSWGLDGRVLMACSWDGTVMFFHFKDGEIGRAVSPEDKLAALENLYGKRLVHGKAEPVIEIPELLDVAPEEITPVVVVEPEQPPPAPKPEEVVVHAKQIEVKRADGKRRITPISLPKDGPLPNPGSFSTSSSVKTKIVVEQRSAEDVAVVQSPAVVAVARATTVCTPSSSDAPPLKRKRLSLMQADVATPPTPASLTYRSDARPVASNLLRPLGALAAVTTAIFGSNNDVLAVENQKEPSIARIRRESRSGETSVVWENVLGHAVVAARANLSLTVLICSDRSVHIVNSSCGVPLRLPLLLPGAAACVDLTAQQLLCVVTTCGYVIVWDLRKDKLLLRDSTLKGELLCDPAAFTVCRLRENGLPIVLLNNGRSFSYSTDMGWQLLTDVKTPLWQLASQKDTFGLVGSGSPYRDLVREARASSNAQSANSRVSTVQSATGVQCCTALLFQHMHASDILGSESEFTASLLTLVRHLAQSGAVSQLRDVMTMQATPRGLLQQCLNIIKGFLPCQRLYSELSGPRPDGDDSLGPPSMDTDCV